MKKYFVRVGEVDFQIETESGRMVVNGEDVEPVLQSSGDGRHLLMVGKKTFEILETGNDRRAGKRRLHVNGAGFDVEIDDEKSKTLKDLAAAKAGASSSAVVSAPMPGKIVKILVETGSEVQHGQGLLILEAMKMENELRSPVTGTVANIRAREGEIVEKGVVLVEIH